MAIFKIDVKDHNITTCTQVQTVMFSTPTEVAVDREGNGVITLSAKSPEEAMKVAGERLKAEGSKKLN
jgi:hypothetical protein